MRIEQVAPEKIRLVWDHVRPELEKLLREFKDEWIPEDLYSDVKASKAHLFVLNDGAIRGFFVVEIVTDRNSQNRSLNVWVLCAEQVAAGQKDALVTYLDDIAKRCGCSRITYGSGRTAWARAMKGIFEVKSIVLERKVQ